MDSIPTLQLLRTMYRRNASPCLLTATLPLSAATARRAISLLPHETNGYARSLIARESVEHGLRPIGGRKTE